MQAYTGYETHRALDEECNNRIVVVSREKVCQGGANTRGDTRKRAEQSRSGEDHAVPQIDVASSGDGNTDKRCACDKCGEQACKGKSAHIIVVNVFQNMTPHL